MQTRVDMSGKRVLVTGAGTGIGQGVGLAFARSGANVVFHYSRSGDGAESAAASAAGLGVKATAMQADFFEIDHVRRLADEAQAFLGGIDILINNAGITMNRPFLDVTPEQFDTIYHVNIRAMYFLTQSLGRTMVEQGAGVVINLSSVHAYHGFVEHSVYAGTKGAIVAFTRTVSVELAPKGVRVNAIAPGWIIVENHYKAMDINEDTVTNGIPAGFLGQPDDVAQLALYLASDAARYVIGQTFMIDGGQMAVMPGVGDFRQPVNARFGAQYVPGL